MKPRRTLEDLLASVSEVLYPAELGRMPIAVNSTDPDGDTPMHVMAWRKDFYGVRTLVEAGADINAVGDMGQTPLHVAVSQSSPEIAAFLLEQRARTDIVSEFGETSEQQAMKAGGDMARVFNRKHIPGQT